MSSSSNPNTQPNVNFSPTANISKVTNKVSESIRNIRINPSSEKARKVVLAKGIFDVLLSLSLIFAPSLLYDGPLTTFASGVTGLDKPNWYEDPASAYGLASLIMGCAFAEITAGQSSSDEAYKTIATLNGVFAITGLMGCLFSPLKFGSSFLLLAATQDVFWFAAIVQAGGYAVLDTLGMMKGVAVRKVKQMASQGREYGEKGEKFVTDDVVGRGVDAGKSGVKQGVDVGSNIGGNVAQTGSEAGKKLGLN